MTSNSRERETRLRLARHRPRPDRVRRRERVREEASPDASARTRRQRALARWRSIDWGRWGTIAGIFVGAAGLIFTAWASYYNAEVASATLEQSKEDAEKEERRQASLVNYWTDEKRVMHIVNRSADPLTGTLVYVVVEQADYTPDHDDPNWKFWNQVGLYAVVLDTIEPCSHITISAGDVITGSSTPSTLTPIKQPADSATSIAMINFVDSQGFSWVRSGGQLIKKSERTDEMFLQMSKEHNAKTALLKGSRSVKTVTSCSNDTK